MICGFRTSFSFNTIAYGYHNYSLQFSSCPRPSLSFGHGIHRHNLRNDISLPFRKLDLVSVCQWRYTQPPWVKYSFISNWISCQPLFGQSLAWTYRNPRSYSVGYPYVRHLAFYHASASGKHTLKQHRFMLNVWICFLPQFPSYLKEKVRSLKTMMIE